ncbi:MAG: hypothetical protein U0V49_14680 [Saprospiraceae bacterium]
MILFTTGYNNFAPTGFGAVALPDSVLSSFLLAAKKPYVILFTTGYKNFTPSGLGAVVLRNSIYVKNFVCRQKFVFSVALQRAIARCYKNFTPSGLGGIASRDSIFVIIFNCFAQKCRQKFVFSVALQRAIARCYKNFTPSGLGAVVLRDSVLSSFLIASHKNAAKNLCFPLHCNGLSPVATKISPL